MQIMEAMPMKYRFDAEESVGELISDLKESLLSTLDEFVGWLELEMLDSTNLLSLNNNAYHGSGTTNAMDEQHNKMNTN